MGADAHDHAVPEPGSQTELINPAEVAAMAAARPPQEPTHGPRHRQGRDDEFHHYVWMVVASLAIIAAFALLVAGLVSADRRNREELEARRTACEQVLVALRAEAEEYEQLRGGDAQEAAKISDIQVTDAATVHALDEQLHAQAPTLPACSAATVERYDELVAQMDDHHEWFEAHSEALQAAVDGVLASKQAKDVSDRQSQMAELLREVQITLDLTKGKVKDDAVWTKLETLRNQAQQAVDAGDAQRMAELEAQLRDGMDQVGQSRDAKTAEDQRKAEEKARKEAEEKAKAEKQEKEKEKEEKAKAEQNRDKDSR